MPRKPRYYSKDDEKLWWTWNIMDSDTRYWLASEVGLPNKQDGDAINLLRVSQGVAGTRPVALITDGHRAYRTAVRRLWSVKWAGTEHHIIPPMMPLRKRRGQRVQGGPHQVHPGNNIMERLQGTQRKRTKVMRGFKRPRSAQSLINGYRLYYNHARPHMGLHGRTPGEATGLNMPVIEGESRVFALAVAGYRARKKA